MMVKHEYVIFDIMGIVRIQRMTKNADGTTKCEDFKNASVVTSQLLYDAISRFVYIYEAKGGLSIEKNVYGVGFTISYKNKEYVLPFLRVIVDFLQLNGDQGITLSFFKD